MIWDTDYMITFDRKDCYITCPIKQTDILKACFIISAINLSSINDSNLISSSTRKITLWSVPIYYAAHLDDFQLKIQMLVKEDRAIEIDDRGTFPCSHHSHIIIFPS